MSYHDKLLSRIRDVGYSRTRINVRKAMLRGIRDISLRPATDQLVLGSLYDDVRAVGQDMKAVLEDMRSGD